MAFSDVPEQLKRLEIPGRVTFLEGNGEMLKIELNTDCSSAELYLHGAQVTDFCKHGEPPLLFVSQCSQFADNQPIRGGVPIVFPWFGSREGMPAHGFARVTDWELHEVSTIPEGGVSLRFGLPESSLGAIQTAFMANYVVTITDKLALELIITNTSADQPFAFETCFHTYYAVEDVNVVSVTGLKGATYLDALENMTSKTETAEAIAITSEVDRVYYNTDATVEILDPKLRRKIRVEKRGSASTILWNPGLTKSQQMPDFGNEEYRRMLCVETGNVGPNRVNLPPGKSCILGLTVSSELV